MIVTQERLAGALSPEQYMAQMRENREVFLANFATALSGLTAAERAPFERLSAPLTLLVLTEDWCGDSAANLPIVVALAQATGKLDVRILTRDGNEDLADRYLLADGRNHIPTYIVLDERLDEIGHVIERPAAISAKLDEFKEGWFAARPHLGTAESSIGDLDEESRERYLAERGAARADLADLERREIVAAFTAIAERTLAPA